MAAKKNAGTDKAEGTFEGALQRLESVVKEMEGGELGLDAMIERFEEGQKLIAFCDGKLNEVDRRIEMLVKKGDRVVAEPFEPEDDESDERNEKAGSGSVPF